MKKYSEEVFQFIKDNAKGKFNDDLAEMVNTKFGTDFTINSMRAYKANHKIVSGMTRKEVTARNKGSKILTPLQHRFIEKYADGIHNKDLHKILTTIYGADITLGQMLTYKKNHGITSGLKGTEGMPPPNKGKKCPNQRNSGNFKPGNMPATHREVGSTRISKDGYLEMKVAEPRTWRAVHVVEWEKHHGKVPKGCAVIFKDRDQLNNNIDNLALVSRAELLVLNRHKLIYKDPQFTETGINIAKVITTAQKRRKNI